MYIHNHKSHRIHDINDQVYTLYHFINRVIGGLPPADHHGTPTQGTIRDLVLKPANHKTIPSFIKLSRFGGTRAISAIIPICQKKQILRVKVMRR